MGQTPPLEPSRDGLDGRPQDSLRITRNKARAS